VDKRFLIVLTAFLVLGCVQQSGEETKLEEFEGLGILQFGMPTRPGVPTVEVEKVTPNSSAYLSLILRNNAEGSIARDIVVSLDNLEPFMIMECGEVYEPSSERTGEPCYSFYDDEGLPYRSHGLKVLNPDEEVEFFWVLRSPTKEEIGNMYYEHEIYATVEYHYHTSIYMGIAAMTFQEYSSRKASGLPLTATKTASAGAIRVFSNTIEPVTYVQGSTGQNFVLSFKVINQGKGIPKPGSKVRITLEYDDRVVELLGESPMEEAGDAVKDWFQQEYGKPMGKLLYMDLDPINLMSEEGYTVNIPFNLRELSPNYQTIPFYVRVSYDYQIEESTKVGVIPIK